MTYDKKELEAYASLIVHSALCLKKGDNLQIRCNEHGLQLAEAVGVKAYEAGAYDVVINLGLDEVSKARFLHAPEEAMEYYPKYHVDYQESLSQDNYHKLFIDSMNPELLKDADPKRVAAFNKKRSAMNKPLQKYSLESIIKWNIAAFPSPSWAKSVFPELGEKEGQEKLWKLIKQAVRLDKEDPVAAWTEHDEKLKKRVAYLNEKQFEKFHYKSDKTDFWVHMAEKHLWSGGSFEREGGNYFPNMPTEEVFSAPHAFKAEGRLHATLPLSLHGHLIEDFYFDFKEGKVVDFDAKKGKEVLEGLLDTDEGAKRLGEIALVDILSPIYQSGVLFNNTLYDENAACHFALGNAISVNLQDYDKLSEEERKERGFNESNIHVDFMVGSDKLTITGYTHDGKEDIIMKDGVWSEHLK